MAQQLVRTAISPHDHLAYSIKTGVFRADPRLGSPLNAVHTVRIATAAGRYHPAYSTLTKLGMESIESWKAGRQVEEIAEPGYTFQQLPRQ